MEQEALEQIEQIIGYKFSDRNLPAKAFSHSSAVDNRFLSNERLEFLGDAILAIVICQKLFERFPDYLEGNLTKIKSMLVSRRTCARIARQLELQKLLRVGKGMGASRALLGSLAAGVFEALIAAIYLDGGFEPAQKFILRCFAELIAQADAEHSQGNFKSILQQYAQQKFNSVPVYSLLDEKGPDHDKCFESTVTIEGRNFPSAWDTTKKEAEQKAAFNALVELGVIERITHEHPSY
jgi:ribonuclease-3